MHYRKKTPPATPTQWAKETTLIAEDSLLHEIDENRLSGAKPNSVTARIFRGATIDDMKDPETVLKTLTNKHNFTCWYK